MQIGIDVTMASRVNSPAIAEPAAEPIRTQRLVIMVGLSFVVACSKWRSRRRPKPVVMLGSGRGYSVMAHRASYISYMRCLASIGHWAANTVLLRQHEHHSDYIYDKHQTEPDNRQIVSH